MRVALMLSASRKRVATSSRAGKTAKSSGFLTNIAISSTSSAPVMLTASSMSITKVGSGTIIMTTIETTAMGTPYCANRLDRTLAPLRPARAERHSAESMAEGEPSWLRTPLRHIR